MRVHAVAFAIAIAFAASQSLPRTGAIVTSVTAYVRQYQDDFVQLVADEDVTQRVLNGAAVTATRQTHGEMFSTFVDDRGGWMSVHDIQTVDGVQVSGRPDVRALLRPASIREIGPRLAAENARFNLGHVSRNFNEPTLALLLFTPAHVRDLSVDRDRVPLTTGAIPLVTLRVRLDRDAPLVRSLAGRVSTTGTFVVDPVTGRVHQTMVTFDDGRVVATLETTYAVDAHVSAWVPVTFIERYTDRRTGEVTDVTTTLGNYRRFGTSGRVVVKPGD
jgi:hypothetical protein